MTTWSVRCRNTACRMRRISKVHPFEDDRACPTCKSVKGWRIEQRGYNKRGLCYCSGPVGDSGPFPHRPTHQMCEQHPRGAVNQARRAGATDDDIPLEFLGVSMKADAECPF